MVKFSAAHRWITLFAALLLLSACVPAPAPSATPASTAASAPTRAQPVAPTAAVQATIPSGPGASTPLVPDTGATALPATQTAAETDAPQCTAPAELTPSQTEGPYFKAGSPERASLVDDLPGTRLVLTGYVLESDCQPIPNALLDFWQADSQGQYDNAGFTLRGHQFTDANGRYRLETVVPGQYPGRTEHIHVKVQVPGGPVLTTQLYFPGVSQNDRDGIFSPAMLIEIQSETAEEVQGRFNFIVAQ